MCGSFMIRDRSVIKTNVMLFLYYFLFYLFQILENKLMERPKRIRKPNMRYDPNVYVLASFPKKKKHTIIPKHQVTIDVIDEQNGTIRSSGFEQPVRIIAEGI